MSQNSVGALVVIALIAFGLLLADRYYRLSPYLEGFQGGAGAGVRCGVDLPPCDFPLHCMNGICRSTAMPYIPPSSGLPVLP